MKDSKNIPVQHLPPLTRADIEAEYCWMRGDFTSPAANPREYPPTGNGRDVFVGVEDGELIFKPHGE